MKGAIELLAIVIGFLLVQSTGGQGHDGHQRSGLNLTRWIDDLVAPPALLLADGASITLSIRQVAQTMHSHLNATQVWAYGSPSTGWTTPGPTLVSPGSGSLNVTYSNELPPHHLFGVPDSTLVMGIAGLPESRVVTHLHGGHTEEAYDGLPEAWYSPGFAQVGAGFQSREHVYVNEAHSTLLMYHDHAMGITRSNVMAGLAGAWLITGDDEAVLAASLPSGKFVVPLIIQDRAFGADGQLLFQGHSAWQMEWYGDVAVVNGRAWPRLRVEACKYRFRILNACNDRYLNVALVDAAQANASVPGPQFIQIGGDQGLLPAPVAWGTRRVLMSPGERFDMVVDFAGLANRSFFLHNSALAPFSTPAASIGASDLPQLLLIEVVEGSVTVGSMATGGGTVPGSAARNASAPPACPALAQLPATLTATPREILPAAQVPAIGANSAAVRSRVFELSTDANGVLVVEGRMYHEPITTFVPIGSTEVWEFRNRHMTMAHPMHVHPFKMQVIDFFPLIVSAQGACTGTPNTTAAAIRVAPPHERGWKDVVNVPACSAARVAMHFDLLGQYVVHCHALSHEDRDMMRPYAVIQPSPSPQSSPAAGSGGGGNSSTGAVIVITVPADELPLRIGGFIGGILLGVMLAAGIIAGARIYWKRNHEGKGSAKVAQQPAAGTSSSGGTLPHAPQMPGASGNLKLQAGGGVAAAVGANAEASAKLYPPGHSHGPQPSMGSPQAVVSNSQRRGSLSRGDPTGDAAPPPPPYPQPRQSPGPGVRSPGPMAASGNPGPGPGSPYLQAQAAARTSSPYGSPTPQALAAGARSSPSRGGSPALGPGSPYSPGPGSPSLIALPPSLPAPTLTPTRHLASADPQAASPFGRHSGGYAAGADGHYLAGESASSQSYAAAAGSGPSNSYGGHIAVHGQVSQISSGGLPSDMRYQPCPVDSAGSSSSGGHRDSNRHPTNYGYSSPGPL